MNNGVSSRLCQDDYQYRWAYEGEKSMPFFTEDEARLSYITRLLSSPYTPLIEGKPLADQIRIVFGDPS